jgi:hypothetical protein
MVELSDGGGGLPYLGSATAYNAGDWENALRTFHDSGVYDTELGLIDSIAKGWLLRFVHAGGTRARTGARTPSALGSRSSTAASSRSSSTSTRRRCPTTPRSTPTTSRSG